MTDRVLTFAFVDLAGFTALTDTHGDSDAADLIDRFVGFARAALDEGDLLVKSMGDAVMLASPEPAAGIGLVQRLVVACTAASEFPQPRAGLHHGSAVQRGDDFIGTAVNLAARVAGQAAGAQVLGTTVVASAAARLGIGVRPIGPTTLRNILEPVELFALAMVPEAPDCDIDPVCRMQVDRRSAAGRIRYSGRDWHFCSIGCVGAFAADAERYSALD